MRIGTDHLPPEKRAELDQILRLLFIGFEESLGGRRAPHRVDGRILKVVLYGSHARGDWVSDPIGGYVSDYDLLIVVNHDELSDPIEYWSDAEETLARELTVTRRLRTPVSFVVHGIADLNRQLRRGRPFFTTIVREGVILYDVPGTDLDASVRLTPDETLAEARQHFDDWYPSAGMFVRAGRFLRAEGGLREAAFQYHQAAERLYHCALLVTSLYSPKSHRLGLLRSQAEAMTPTLAAAWPRASATERRSFELLRRAYVEARYSPHFRISERELEEVDSRIDALRGLVLDVAADRLGMSHDELSRRGRADTLAPDRPRR